MFNNKRCLSVFIISNQAKNIITIASHNGNMINLTKQNNYIQFEGSSRVIKSGSIYIHMFLYAQPVCLLVDAFNPFSFAYVFCLEKFL